MPTYHFHISRSARAKYRVDDSLFSLRGNIVFANFYAARLLAEQINAVRDPAAGVQAGELNALGLIHEILHSVLQQYRTQRGDIMAQAVRTLSATVGESAVETTLAKFIDEFPPLPVYRGQETIPQYLNGNTGGISNREITLEEMLLVWIENQNPAASPFHELFDDSALAQTTAYPQIIAGLRDFFAAQEPFGPARESLFDVLRAPITAAPGSLSDQLNFMLNQWSAVAGRFDLTRFFARAAGSAQFIQEEQRFLFNQQTNPFGGGGGFTSTTPPVPTFRREFELRTDATGAQYWVEPEPEQFSPDLAWAPNLVLLAKSTYVWLDQLSKKYARPITRLDEIPDAELDELQQRGITGLWFIGVWERSQASAQIKHLLGNPDALASAYSLYDYEISGDLGGTPALDALKARAWLRGIRLGSDMVPNHMGIDSKWVTEHPEWFIQSATPPYPSYRFTGANLSIDPRMTVQIEDHYWDKTDAAVVFKRTGHNPQGEDVRYIYHGNDGTTFPWDDTAQLNYLRAEVREQVIQTILKVARMTPVIRFDAAMTLTKKHFQRLWYPLPGETDTIASRGEYTMTKTEFDALMPEEFWREVVDRVAAEAPDTLLLAEAFWLLEGYFVRTLGMHRVYNSAFMHMLRDEKNVEYRLVIKNTIEFDPEVLKRYVNFMNNPDERTAVDQFGKGDKYFGVSVMLSTLPGLPMFGHGQIEGFAERYGMEFHKAMLDETPDPWLLERHAREIFPLLHKRQLFADVENFLLYDVYRPDGTVDENVFAYSNRSGTSLPTASLVAYNNSFSHARGKIRLSAAFRDKAKDELVQRPLADGLNLSDTTDSFVIFREHISNLEYIRRAHDLVHAGLELDLGAYKYLVYLDFRQVVDAPDHSYARLHDRLRGRGVPNIADALRDMNLEPLHHALRAMLNGDTVIQARTPRPSEPAPVNGSSAEPDPLVANAAAFAHLVNEWNDTTIDESTFTTALTQALAQNQSLPALPATFKRPAKKLAAALADLQPQFDDSAARDALTALAFARALETLAGSGAKAAQWLDQWLLTPIFVDALRDAGVNIARAWQLGALLKIALRYPAPPALDTLLSDPDTAQFLNINTFDGVQWFNQEGFNALIDWYQLLGALDTVGSDSDAKTRGDTLVRQSAQWQQWRAAEAQSEYRVDKLKLALAPVAPKPARSATAPAAYTLAEPAAVTPAAATEPAASAAPTPKRALRKAAASKPAPPAESTAVPPAEPPAAPVKKTNRRKKDTQ